MLLLIGFFLFLPLTAGAEPLSPWVAEVVERVEEGIVFASGIEGVSCEPETQTAEIKTNLGLVREHMTAELTKEMEAQMLREATVCLEYDRRILQDTIRRLQEQMEQAVTDCRFGSVTALRENYTFAIRAYRVFLRGATDPSFADDMLRFRYPFQNADLWNAGARDPVFSTGSTAPICPYTTDYGPHSIGYVPVAPGFAGSASDDIRSFGCDSVVLATIDGSLQPEADALRGFMERTREVSATLFDTASLALFNIEVLIAALEGRLPPSEQPGAKPVPPHLEITGCLRPLVPDADAQPDELEALLSAYPDYFEPIHFNEAEGTYGPTDGLILPEGILMSPSYDFFGSMPNSAMLIRAFTDRREDTGYARPLPKYLVGTMFDSFFLALFRQTSTSNNLRDISSNIEREAALIESYSRDAMQRMRDTSVPLEAAVQSLIEVTEEYLPNEYIPELAFFLARSCVDGHCQRTLDAVAKRTFNPYCHPYASGKYLEEDAHKKCYCDPEIESSDSDFWNTYCSDDLSGDREKYEAMEPEFFPGCMEEVVL